MGRGLSVAQLGAPRAPRRLPGDPPRGLGGAHAPVGLAACGAPRAPGLAWHRAPDRASGRHARLP
eukprot:607078-Alexandrium_andersonii.AAC.1